MKTIAKMKSDTEQTLKLNSCTKLALKSSSNCDLITQSLRASEKNLVVVGQLSIATSNNRSVV